MIFSALQWLLYSLEALAIIYLIMVGIYSYGLLRLRNKKLFTNETPVKVSVMVAARNEAPQLRNLFESILMQSYPKHLIELIIIDDHSDDNTAGLIREIIESNTFSNLILLLNDSAGKKAALQKGLHTASGELVLVTDADCMVPEQWVQTMVAAFRHNSPRLILGPVRIKPQHNWLLQMQEIEFASLVGSAAGAAGAGAPVMGNAANIGFDRQTAIDMNAFDPSNSASGDDMFLMMAIRKAFGSKAIQYVYHKEAIVETNPLTDIKSFLHQRMRWVAKSRLYTDPVVIVPSIIVLGLNLLMLLVFVGGFVSPVFFVVFALFVLLKFMIDYPLLYIITGFINRRNLLKWALIIEIIYPFYVVGAALLAFTHAHTWKGRSHTK
jgi:poly-beta-1,6-N-acetyl-D-glucosamine synthase